MTNGAHDDDHLVRDLAWAEIRRHWRGALVIGLVLGIGAGAVLTAAAGARRTDTAYPRMLDATQAGHLLVSGFNEDPVARGRFYAQVAALDGVEIAGTLAAIFLVPMEVPKGAGTAIEACSSMSADGVYGYAIERPNVIDGRLPMPDRSDEVLVTANYADTFGIAVGDQLDLVHYSDEGSPRAGEVTADDGPVIHVEVVGIGVPASQVVPVSDLDAAPRMFGGPAFMARYAPDQSGQCYDAVALSVVDGTDLEGVIGEIDRLGRSAGGALIQDRGTDVDVRRAIQPQVSALYLFAAAVALVTALVVAQLLGRQLQQSAATAAPVWRAVGATRVQVRLLVAAPGLVTATVGGVVSLIGALLLSSRFPVGPARLAETDPGTALHAAIHLGGAALVVIATIATSIVAAAMTLRTRTPSERLGWLARASATTSRPSLLLGMHLAIGSRRGRAAVPVRSAAAGTALAIAAVAATITVAAGLDQLVSEPSRYGKDWDVMVDGVFAPVPVDNLLDVLQDADVVEAIAGGRYGEATIDGQRVATVGLSDLVGETFPAIIDGRAPASADEIVIGTGSLRELRRSIADQVSVDTGAGPRAMTVVGTAAFPRLNHGSFSALGLGTGAATRTEALPPFDLASIGAPPDFDTTAFTGPGGAMFEFLTIRLTPTATPEQRANLIAALDDAADGEHAIRTEQRPIAIDRYADVRSTPILLAVVLGSMAAATLAHLVVSVVWRRRRDLALCGGLGMRRAQLLRAVVIQALLIAGVALVIGLPVGIAAGRLAWQGFAAELGVASRLALPVGAIFVAVLLTAVIAVAVSAVPAVISSRTRPATVLRAD